MGTPVIEKLGATLPPLLPGYRKTIKWAIPDSNQ